MKLLSLDNYTELKPWCEKYGWREYNSNITTMLMWNDTYPMYFKIYEHFALVCFEYDHIKHWLMPFSKKEYLKEALDTLLVYSKQYQIPCMLHGVTVEAKNLLEAYYPKQIYFEYHERAGDYVYDRHQQESLSGKKMQKRRNHYNAFLKEYGERFEVVSLSEKDFPAIYDLIDVWTHTKEENEQESIHKERKGIDFLLENFERLQLKGACIYIDGKLEAFNIASNICEDMIQIHIEKANRNIRGLYVAIVKHLLMMLDEKVLYVNREDDMGLASLRKAKHDMRPIYKERKHLAVFDTITITHPNPEDIEEMRSLWLSSFEDENEETTNFFFTHIMKTEDAWVYRNSDEIMGMAFVNRWQMNLASITSEVAFIEGVCTKQNYANCGVMSKLMTHILQEYKDMPIAIQAYNWDLYRKFGFVETHHLKETYIDTPLEGYLPISEVKPNLMEKIYRIYTSNKSGYRIHDKTYYEDFYIPYMKACGFIIQQYEDKGYACFSIEQEHIYIHTIHAINDNCVMMILASLQKQYQKPIYVVSDTNLPLVGKKRRKIALMMISPIAYSNAYVNEMI